MIRKVTERVLCVVHAALFTLLLGAYAALLGAAIASCTMQPAHAAAPPQAGNPFLVVCGKVGKPKSMTCATWFTLRSGTLTGMLFGCGYAHDGLPELLVNGSLAIARELSATQAEYEDAKHAGAYATSHASDHPSVEDCMHVRADVAVFMREIAKEIVRIGTYRSEGNAPVAGPLPMITTPQPETRPAPKPQAHHERDSYI